MNDITQFIRKLFQSGDWPARWKCGIWSEFHGWLYIISDVFIALAYFTIPVIIFYFVRKNGYKKFNMVLVLFGLFIFACGSTHLIDAYIFWNPIYRLSAVARFITAIISLTTVFVLYRYIPDFISLKSPIELNNEIEQRKRSEMELSEIKNSLEEKVKKRTKTLEEINKMLEEEIQTRRRNEKIMRDSEEKFRTLVESSPNAILLTNKEGEIQLINAQAEHMFGYTRDELISQSIETLLPKEFRSNHPNNRKTFFNSPEKRPMGMGRDLFALHKNGKKIPVEIGLTPINDRGNIKVLSTVVDITERKKIEDNIKQKNKAIEESYKQIQEKTAQLIQSEKMNALGLLVSGVAHELNNPLTGILTFAQYCQSHVEDNSKVQEVLGDIIFEANRCDKIIKDLLLYSYRQNSDDKEIVTKELKDVIGRVLNLYADLLSDIQLKIEIQEDYPDFYINANKLQQVLMNLFKNAIDAMEENPDDNKQLIINAYYTNDHCFIKISDTGKGIKVENQHKIFDPFYTDKETGKGTGLGLSVTKNILNECEGDISFVSTLNRGTEFTLKFKRENLTV